MLMSKREDLESLKDNTTIGELINIRYEKIREFGKIF